MRADRVATETGLRRVDWVRMSVESGRLRAEAVGVGFRLPTACSIPLATAARLIAAGTPYVTHVVSADGTGR